VRAIEREHGLVLAGERGRSGALNARAQSRTWQRGLADIPSPGATTAPTCASPSTSTPTRAAAA